LAGADSSLAGAGASGGGADSCEGAGSSLAGADSREGLGSEVSGLDSRGGASWEGETSGVVLDRGASLGDFSPLAAFDEPCAGLFEALALRPGKALAATSEKIAVSASAPATIQRLARFSLRRATSLAFAWIGRIVSTGSGRRVLTATAAPFNGVIQALPPRGDEMIHIFAACNLSYTARSLCPLAKRPLTVK
jgi:hypothetical protein